MNRMETAMIQESTVKNSFNVGDGRICAFILGSSGNRKLTHSNTLRLVNIVIGTKAQINIKSSESPNSEGIIYLRFQCLNAINKKEITKIQSNPH